MQRQDIVNIVAAFQTAMVLDGLHRTGVLASLRTPATAVELALRCGVDQRLLAPLLEYAAVSSVLVERREDGRFALVGDDRRLAFAAHMLDQYIGGYGPPLGAIADALRTGATATVPPDLQRHAAAFAGDQPDDGLSEAAVIILDLGITRLVEFGCGGGQTLCAIAAANPEISCLGIEANPAAAAAAADRIRARGLSGRVRIETGGALEVLQREVTEGIQAILAASMLNAFWRSAGDLAAFLMNLAQLLPGRLLLVSDYYSHLGRAEGGEARTLLHDLVQVVSGQGLPPPSIDPWAAAYAAAGAELVHALEAAGDGIDRFVHLVRLPG